MNKDTCGVLYVPLAFKTCRRTFNDIFEQCNAYLKIGLCIVCNPLLAYNTRSRPTVFLSVFLSINAQIFKNMLVYL